MINGKQKGKKGELELAKLFRDCGYEASRTQQYCGKTGVADIESDFLLYIECKRIEQLNIFNTIRRAEQDSQGKTVAVFWRRNKERWTMCVDAKEFLENFTITKKEETL